MNSQEPAKRRGWAPTKAAFFCLLTCVLGVAVAGCAAAQGPGTRLMDSASDLNQALRFGRTDIALEQTLPAARESFLERHQAWGSEIRVIDMNLTGMDLKDESSAEVTVEVAWTRMSEGTVRTTSVRQRWVNEERGWLLEREHRIAGSAGLFGEPLPIASDEPVVDVHFPSRSLGVTQ